MKLRALSAFVIAASLTAAVCAQDSGSAPPAGQDSSSEHGGGYGQRGGRGFGGMMGRGLMGTVTEAAADHYTVKTDQGDAYTIRLSADTRIFKRQASAASPGGQGEGAGQGGGRRMGGRWTRRSAS